MGLVASRAEKAETTQRVKNRIKGETLGGLTDLLHTLREEKRVKEAEVKEIEARYHATEEQLMALLEAQGTDKAAGKLASVSITSSIEPNVEDWDRLYAYVKRTGYFHLFQRRVSSPACRELFESKGSIPGVVPFTRKKLNLRSI